MTPVKTTATPRKDIDKEAEKVAKSQGGGKEPAKPAILGLPKGERLKTMKQKKKRVKQKNVEKPSIDVTNMTRNDFLICPETGNIEHDPDNDENDLESGSEVDSDDSDEAFEDSKEALSESEDGPAPKVDDEFLTPVNLKSKFARTLQAKTTSRSTSTPNPKRPAGSPADPNQSKKPRAQLQSQIPRKK